MKLIVHRIVSQFYRKHTIQRQIETSLRRGLLASTTRSIGDSTAILLDTVPLLRHVLCPQLRSVSLQLLSPRERDDLRHTVEVMVDLGLIYVQTKSADGTYQYQLEPNIQLLGTFDNSGGSADGSTASTKVSYTGRQLIAREVELEKMRRVVPKAAATTTTTTTAKATAAAKKPQRHLQTLQKAMEMAAPRSNVKETVGISVCLIHIAANSCQRQPHR